ncbi:hypothetical protein V6N13_120930 [Hibiscus sabdariffa]|uniref:Secreted protein n=1 Tax=Hibiscus sabdariffa TaxID=183260 RepID=A0ABR2E693_9ROSI
MRRLVNGRGALISARLLGVLGPNLHPFCIVVKLNPCGVPFFFDVESCTSQSPISSSNNMPEGVPRHFVCAGAIMGVF